MLRRPATVITLTPEDIMAYESNRHNDSYMTEPAFSQSQDTVEQSTSQERQRTTRTREDRILGNRG
ncbi:hypothetical protein SLS58_004960 [Diplodia intermedia]|uniref:Anaphase-promoting complex subunit CDC26 n=1 Tax=Diplodia intermedia TaxID=856260 RepID=A0ABR3TS84_9PEZI